MAAVSLALLAEVGVQGMQSPYRGRKAAKLLYLGTRVLPQPHLGSSCPLACPLPRLSLSDCVIWVRAKYFPNIFAKNKWEAPSGEQQAPKSTHTQRCRPRPQPLPLPRPHRHLQDTNVLLLDPGLLLFHTPFNTHKRTSRCAERVCVCVRREKKDEKDAARVCSFVGKLE